MTTTDILDDYDPEAFEKMAEWFGKGAPDTLPDNVNALQLYVWLKRVQGLADALMGQLLPDANVTFAELSETSKSVKAWPVTDFSTVTRNQPAGTWAFPASVIAQEAQLKNTKETMKKNKQATYTPGVHDPAKNSAFRVHLQKV